MYDRLEVRNLLLMHNCLPACLPARRGLGTKEPPKVCLAALRCFHYAAPASNFVCASKQDVAGLPERDVSELSGSDPWEDRHLIISRNHKASLFVCLFPVCLKPPLEGTLAAVRPGELVGLFQGSTSFLPIFSAAQRGPFAP